MSLTVLEPESMYPDQTLEQCLLPGTRLLAGGGEGGLAQLSAETMRDVLLEGRNTNVIAPE